MLKHFAGNLVLRVNSRPEIVCCPFRPFLISPILHAPLTISTWPWMPSTSNEIFLEISRCSNLLHGVKLSILQQPIIFKHYFNILSQKLIRVGRRIRFAIVRKVDEHHWLSNPMIVSKITCYLASASRVILKLIFSPANIQSCH